LVDHETSVKKSESIKIPTNCSFKIWLRIWEEGRGSGRGDFQIPEEC
jgi:hypothetical protein